MPRNPFKIVITGPPRSGKSALANLLCGNDTLKACDVYRPTVVTRIIDVTDLIIGTIRLYDTSGDLKYRNLILSLCEDPDALIILWPSSDSGEISPIQLEAFSKPNNVSPDRCALVFFCPSKDPSNLYDAPKITSVATATFAFSVSNQDNFRVEIMNWIRKLHVYNGFCVLKTYTQNIPLQNFFDLLTQIWVRSDEGIYSTIHDTSRY